MKFNNQKITSVSHKLENYLFNFYNIATLCSFHWQNVRLTSHIVVLFAFLYVKRIEHIVQKIPRVILNFSEAWIKHNNCSINCRNRRSFQTTEKSKKRETTRQKTTEFRMNHLHHFVDHYYDLHRIVIFSATITLFTKLHEENMLLCTLFKYFNF